MGDLYIVGILNKYNGDKEKTIAYLKETWGEEYDANAKEYKLDEVLAGKYHGSGSNDTAKLKAYVSKMITSGNKEEIGCVVVTKELAEILQKLMDKYTFAGVDRNKTTVLPLKNIMSVVEMEQALRDAGLVD